MVPVTRKVCHSRDPLRDKALLDAFVARVAFYKRYGLPANKQVVLDSWREARGQLTTRKEVKHAH